MTTIKRWFIGGGFVLCAVIIVYLLLANNDLKEKNVTISNKLAETDSLRTVIQTTHFTLQERYATQGRDLEKTLDKESILRDHLESQKANVLFLTNKVLELRFENQKFKARRGTDSIGEYVACDTVSEYFALSGRARIKPPIFEVESLLFIDSSYIGAYTVKEGFLTGFISHTNPYMLDYGSSGFSVNLGLQSDKPFVEWGGLWLGAGLSRSRPYLLLEPRISFYRTVEVGWRVNTLLDYGLEGRIRFY